MLKSLYIKNFALIEELTINFGPKLNIITGETGAGKSILLGALNIVLGERANTDLIRAGSDKAIVEATLNITNNFRLIKIIEEQNLSSNSQDNLILLRRELSTKSSSRCFINDSLVPLHLLREISDLAIDLHGQHEHQSLLHIETHLSILDNYGNLESLRETFHNEYQQILQVKKRLVDVQKTAVNIKQQSDLFKMQLKEINSLNPQPNEIETLLTEEKILENSEALLRDTTKLDEILYGDDNSIHNQLVKAKHILDDLSKIDPLFTKFASHLLDCRSVIDDVNQHVQSYQSKIEFNPIHLEELRERSVALNQLRKKYGGSLEQVLAYKEKIEKEVSLVENFDEEIAKLKNEIANIRLRLNERALQLSFKRQEVASQLSHLIELKLKELGIANSTFHVDFKKSENINGDVSFEGKTYEVNASGLDTIEFLISTNIGESLKPLIKVASGGEISRIMLAIKSILAKSSQLPVLVFDEIDTGISGKIAQAVGFSLKKLSNYHQLIVITHLPQVAAMKETHFRVEKSIQGERTYTTVKQLSDAEHEAEVAKLLAGATITEASLRSAKELIHASRNI